MAWQTLNDAVNKLKMRYTYYNNIRNNLLELKTQFSVEHDWSTGLHDYSAIDLKGPEAWVVFTGGPNLLVQESFRTKEVFQDATGVYGALWTSALSYASHGIACGIYLLSDAAFTGKMCDPAGATSPPGARVTIRDISGTAVDLTSNEACVIAAFVA